MKAARMIVRILVLLMAVTPVSATDNRNAIELVSALHAQLGTTSEAPHVARIAGDLGPIVDGARKTLKLEELETLRELLGAMETRSGQILTTTEHKTGQSEAALERLYRSQAWNDLSFAEASFIYWSAWIDLEIARKSLSDRDRILARARKGFQAASLQLFRPQLFYGGWLGIGYVDLELGHTARARQVFKKLDEAVSALPASPVKEAVSMELLLQELRMGDITAAGISMEIDAQQARLLRRELFISLERSRVESKHDQAIARYLLTLIKAGRMDQSLLENIMAYAQEIAAIDVDPWSTLAAAEFRLLHSDYQKAVQKYEAFFKEFIPQQGINLDVFRYRRAFAAYKAGSYQTALGVLEKLGRRKRLTPEIDKAAAKLLYTVHLALALRDSHKTSHKSLHSAAKRFVDKNPDDPEADQARLLVAQTSQSADSALDTLRQIRSSTEFNGAVERTSFNFLAREYSARITSAQTEAAAELARQGVEAFRKLPEPDRTNPRNIAVLLQMRALVEPGPDELINSLDFLGSLKNYEAEEQEKLVAAYPDEMIRSLGSIIMKGDRDAHINHALSWSRLQLYDRLDDWPGLTEMMHMLNEGNSPGLPLELVYPWIAGREDILQRLELAQIAHPAAATLPDIDRRFYRLIIENLLSIDNREAAHEKALAFTREHPTSGDAWRSLARTAELTGDPFTADKAWNVITDKVLPTSDIWWEGMLNRVRIRSGSTRPEQACPLLEVLQHRAGYLPENQKMAYETLLEDTQCRRINSPV
ncbi:MAG: hypothetical protein OXN26_14040 [Gammaproteobacteria bacterium]|nr:hypothetical protein [Gammaproteobacteria bacterium]